MRSTNLSPPPLQTLLCLSHSCVSERGLQGTLQQSDPGAVACIHPAWVRPWLAGLWLYASTLEPRFSRHRINCPRTRTWVSGSCWVTRVGYLRNCAAVAGAPSPWPLCYFYHLDRETAGLQLWRWNAENGCLTSEVRQWLSCPERSSPADTNLQ